MPPTSHRCAASSLLAPLLDEGRPELPQVARTRMSVHYATGRDDLPLLSVCLPEAVRLPNSLVVERLPSPSSAAVRRGRLCCAGETWLVTRWWRPSRPRRVVARGLTPTDLDVEALVGSGAGLTPDGDDLVAGALVTAYATAHPGREDWVERTRQALREGRTTAVSHALLHHATEGYAVPELAAYVDARLGDRPLERARRDLLAIGHSSGAALLAGVEQVAPAGRRTAA